MNNKTDLYELFVHMQWLIHRYQLHNYREFGPFADQHRGQGRVLALLKLNPEISQKDLSNILNIRSQSLGELLFKLERNGYITRTTSEADRRVIIIKLTNAGRMAANKNEPQSDSDRVFGCLGEDERSVLSGYFIRIITAMETQFADADTNGTDPRPWFQFGAEGSPGFKNIHFNFRGYGWRPEEPKDPDDFDK